MRVHGIAVVCVWVASED